MLLAVPWHNCVAYNALRENKVLIPKKLVSIWNDFCFSSVSIKRDKNVVERQAKTVAILLVSLASGVCIARTIFDQWKKNTKLKIIRQQDRKTIIIDLAEKVRRSDYTGLMKHLKMYTFSGFTVCKDELFTAAVALANPQLVESLLQKGWDPNINVGGDPLIRAVIVRRAGVISKEGAKQSLAILRLLLEKNADPNIRYPETSITPLMHAVGMDLPDMVKMLLQYQADVTIRDAQGKTAYDHAVEQSSSIEIQSLVRINKKY